jgi:hypothetical protein
VRQAKQRARARENESPSAKLLARVGDDGPFDRSSLLDTLNGEIALIDAGLEKLLSPNPDAPPTDAAA